MRRRKDYKYWIIWQGVIPGIFKGWSDVQYLIQNVPGSKCKGCNDLYEVEIFFASKPRSILVPPNYSGELREVISRVSPKEDPRSEDFEYDFNFLGEEPRKKKKRKGRHFNYYVVLKGAIPGVFELREDMDWLVKDIDGAVYKGFDDFHKALDYFGSNPNDALPIPRKVPGRDLVLRELAIEIESRIQNEMGTKKERFL